MSELIHLIHWGVYIGSLIAFLLLLTPLRKWGATWIAVLFLSQVLFSGCFLVKIENHYRAQEGLAPVRDSLLTDRFSQNPLIQHTVSLIIGGLAVGIIFSKHDQRRTS